jgi:hypothetical protein
MILRPYIAGAVVGVLGDPIVDWYRFVQRHASEGPGPRTYAFKHRSQMFDLPVA